MTRPRRWSGRPRSVIVGLTVALTGLVAAANLVTLLSTRSAITTVDRAPHAQAAIVLGARVGSGGALSAMLADRVTQALTLYRSGAVDRIIVSGDHGDFSYDEPGAMRDALLAEGVPPQHIFTDHAGFDTWSTMRRAAEVFGVRSAIVVTQGFHLPRALLLARAAGLQAHGVPSDLRPYGRAGLSSSGREVAARVKAILQISAHSPVVLGPGIPIDGDGRSSWGPPGQ